MPPAYLHPGSSGQAVRDLQNALNVKLVPPPRLQVSGIYDAVTQSAVRRFQRANWLEEDGLAGECTLNLLYNRESGPPILHNVAYLQQPTATTCWAAAAAMLKGTTIDSIRQATPGELLLGDGSLNNESQNGGATRLHNRFAGIHNLHYHPPLCWTISAIIGFLRRGPFMMEALWNLQSYMAGQGSNGHYVVVIGARGVFTSDSATTLRIYDPETPANGGGIYSTSYAAMLRRVPLATYGILTR